MRTSHGSSLRDRSITAKQQCSGRWPGVWIVRSRTSPTSTVGPVLERLVRERGVGVGMDVDRDTVLERETAVAGDVVGVRVRLQHADEAHAPPLRLLQHGLDRVRRVDDDGDAGMLVTDEVGGAAQIVVQELLEQHGPTLTPAPATNLEVSRGPAIARRRHAPRRAAA